MNNMTKISAAIISSIALVGLTHAVTPGAYVGAGLGASKLQTPSLSVTSATSTSTSRGGLGGRLFAGYNVNKYFGVEGGYATYAPSTYKGTTATSTGKLKYSLDAINLVGKGYLPLADTGFNAYVLGGVAAVRSKVRLSGTDVFDGVANVSKTNHALRPTYGAGVSYDFAQHVSTNLELSHIQGKGNVRTSNSAIPSANMVSFNVGYNFG
ncbi:MAG: OmpA-like protein transmembrane protein [uncultured bacterium]|nr:MAG: OmpA-like protein transmembrane protein [uncultured bacterium]